MDAAVAELEEYADQMAPDYYDEPAQADRGPTPAGLKALTADYAHNDDRCPTWNELSWDDQRLVLERVVVPE